MRLDLTADLAYDPVATAMLHAAARRVHTLATDELLSRDAVQPAVSAPDPVDTFCGRMPDRCD